MNHVKNYQEYKDLNELFEMQNNVVAEYPIADEFKSLYDELLRVRDGDALEGIKESNKGYREDLAGGYDGKPFSFYKSFSRYMKGGYSGELSKNLHSLASSLCNYPPHICDLFNNRMDESEYKSTHSEFYDSFEKLSFHDKKVTFQSSDWGRRSLYELERDTYASNIFERMLCEYGGGRLEMNDDASGYGKPVTTKADLYFKSLKDNSERFPLEIKTNWRKEPMRHISFRGKGYERLASDKGMVLCIKMDNTNPTAAIADTCEGRETSSTRIQSKTYMNVSVNENDIMNFKFWEWDDMKNILTRLHDIYKNRK